MYFPASLQEIIINLRLVARNTTKSGTLSHQRLGPGVRFLIQLMAGYGETTERICHGLMVWIYLPMFGKTKKKNN